MPVLHFFIALKVPDTNLGTSNTFSEFTHFLTDLGSFKLSSSVPFLHTEALKRGELYLRVKTFSYSNSTASVHPQPQRHNCCSVQMQRKTPSPTTENARPPDGPPTAIPASLPRPGPPLTKVKHAHQLWATGRHRKCGSPLVAVFQAGTSGAGNTSQKRPPLGPPPALVPIVRWEEASLAATTLSTAVPDLSQYS